MSQDANGNGTREPTSAARSAASATIVSGQVLAVAQLFERLGLDPASAYAAALAYGAVMGALGKVARDALHRHDTGVERLGVGGQVLANLFAALG